MTEMKIKRFNCKLHSRSSVNSKKRIFDYLMPVTLSTISFFESASDVKAFAITTEPTFWENRTNLLEARTLFSRYDDADFNEADYFDSYDTWVKHVGSSPGNSSYISQLREISNHFNNNETSGMTEEHMEDVSSFLDLVNEYEDIKSDLQTKMDFIKSRPSFIHNHPLLPKSGPDDPPQNMLDTDFPFSINAEVNITQWVPYLVPGSSNTTQWIPYVVPGSIQSWNESSIFDNIDPLNKSLHRSANYYSSKFKEYLLSFAGNLKEKTRNSSIRYNLISNDLIHLFILFLSFYATPTIFLVFISVLGRKVNNGLLSHLMKKMNTLKRS